MSKSFKKPIVKNKSDRWYNKIFRRKSKQMIYQGKEPYHDTNEVDDNIDHDWKDRTDNEKNTRK
jgi:hypothetical protein